MEEWRYSSTLTLALGEVEDDGKLERENRPVSLLLEIGGGGSSGNNVVVVVVVVIIVDDDDDDDDERG
jgi:hypothetical protein